MLDRSAALKQAAKQATTQTTAQACGPVDAAHRQGAVDVVDTEIIRHTLNSAANQMKNALVRSAFSPIIYEVLDFAVALYDRKIRLLAQAPSLPLFMGTLSFCIEAAIKALGDEGNIEPGDVILYNWPFGTGAHAQDAALIQPVFTSDHEHLIGYAVIKAHWLDIGASAMYCTNTTDVYQEGTFFPGIKLYRKGERVDDVYRCVLANSRLPKVLAGDIKAQVSGLRIGARELTRIVDRFGREYFERTVERIFDHGEATVRSYFEKLPDGVYVGEGLMDNNGIDDKVIPFEVKLTISGSAVCLDFSDCPDSQPGPINCPLATTVSASRIAISMLAGGNEAPTEGHFRAVKVITRKGSLFDPQPPAPCFLYGWPAMQAIEVIYQALSKLAPEAVPACSGGDICSLVWWGTREKTGEPWADGSPFPVGHGGHAHGDGVTMMHVAESATRFASLEVTEARNPWLVEGCEFNPDSCGAGRHRGGLGYDLSYRLLEDAYVTPAIERTVAAPWGIAGGRDGTPNGASVKYPDGSERRVAKATAMRLPKGALFTIHAGGGAGYGPPGERPAEHVQRDLEGGYITEAYAKRHYPHVFG